CGLHLKTSIAWASPAAQPIKFASEQRKRPLRLRCDTPRTPPSLTLYTKGTASSPPATFGSSDDPCAHLCNALLLFPSCGLHLKTSIAWTTQPIKFASEQRKRPLRLRCDTPRTPPSLTLYTKGTASSPPATFGSSDDTCAHLCNALLLFPSCGLHLKTSIAWVSPDAQPIKFASEQRKRPLRLRCDTPRTPPSLTLYTKGTASSPPATFGSSDDTCAHLCNALLLFPSCGLHLKTSIAWVSPDAQPIKFASEQRKRPLRLRCDTPRTPPSLRLYTKGTASSPPATFGSSDDTCAHLCNALLLFPSCGLHLKTSIAWVSPDAQPIKFASEQRKRPLRLRCDTLRTPPSLRLYTKGTASSPPATFGSSDDTCAHLCNALLLFPSCGLHLKTSNVWVSPDAQPIKFASEQRKRPLRLRCDTPRTPPSLRLYTKGTASSPPATFGSSDDTCAHLCNALLLFPSCGLHLKTSIVWVSPDAQPIKFASEQRKRPLRLRCDMLRTPPSLRLYTKGTASSPPATFGSSDDTCAHLCNALLLFPSCGLHLKTSIVWVSPDAQPIKFASEQRKRPLRLRCDTPRTPPSLRLYTKGTASSPPATFGSSDDTCAHLCNALLLFPSCGLHLKTSIAWVSPDAQPIKFASEQRKRPLRLRCDTPRTPPSLRLYTKGTASSPPATFGSSDDTCAHLCNALLLFPSCGLHLKTSIAWVSPDAQPIKFASEQRKRPLRLRCDTPRTPPSLRLYTKGTASSPPATFGSSDDTCAHLCNALLLFPSCGLHLKTSIVWVSPDAQPIKFASEQRKRPLRLRCDTPRTPPSLRLYTKGTASSPPATFGSSDDTCAHLCNALLLFPSCGLHLKTSIVWVSPDAQPIKFASEQRKRPLRLRCDTPRTPPSLRLYTKGTASSPPATFGSSDDTCAHLCNALLLFPSCGLHLKTSIVWVSPDAQPIKFASEQRKRPLRLRCDTPRTPPSLRLYTKGTASSPPATFGSSDDTCAHLCNAFLLFPSCGLHLKRSIAWVSPDAQPIKFASEQRKRPLRLRCDTPRTPPSLTLYTKGTASSPPATLSRSDDPCAHLCNAFLLFPSCGLHLKTSIAWVSPDAQLIKFASEQRKRPLRLRCDTPRTPPSLTLYTKGTASSPPATFGSSDDTCAHLCNALLLFPSCGLHLKTSIAWASPDDQPIKFSSEQRKRPLRLRCDTPGTPQSLTLYTKGTASSPPATFGSSDDTCAHLCNALLLFPSCGLHLKTSIAW
ncbi:hypothetical protein V5799_000661, partial [Amblyomma americanum]